jgi:hypothetical protein
VSGYGRIGLVGAVLAAGVGAGVASLHAQTQLVDPKDAGKIFASTCSACHKSPQGLAKSGQVAGFLRQHYTTGPEMSAAMAAYLVSAGSGPAGRKGQAEAKAKEPREPSENPAAKAKSRKQEHVGLPPGDRSTEPRPELRPETKSKAKSEAKADAKGGKEQRTLRGKQLQQVKGTEERPAPPATPTPTPTPTPASPADVDGQPPSAAPAATSSAALAPAAPAASAPAAAAPAAPASAAAAPAAPSPVTLDIPMPEAVTAPPPDLTQSVFSSSPVP